MKQTAFIIWAALVFAVPAAADPLKPIGTARLPGATFPTNMQGQWCYTGNGPAGADYLSPGVLGRDCDKSVVDIVVTPTQLRSANGVMTCDLVDGQLTHMPDLERYLATLSCRASDGGHWTERGEFEAPTRGMAGLTWKQTK
jgi:hypothetical protein